MSTSFILKCGNTKKTKTDTMRLNFVINIEKCRYNHYKVYSFYTSHNKYFPRINISARINNKKKYTSAFWNIGSLKNQKRNNEMMKHTDVFDKRERAESFRSKYETADL